MIGGLFSKGSSGHSVRTIGSVHRGRTVGSTNNGYVRGIGHSMPSSSGGMKLNSKLASKVNELQDKFGSSNGD